MKNLEIKCVKCSYPELEVIKDGPINIFKCARCSHESPFANASNDLEVRIWPKRTILV